MAQSWTFSSQIGDKKMITCFSIFVFFCNFCLLLFCISQKPPLKITKILLISLKFFFASTSIQIFTFSSSCLNFYGFRRKFKIEQLWPHEVASIKLPFVIFGKTPKHLWIKASKNGEVINHKIENFWTFWQPEKRLVISCCRFLVLLTISIKNEVNFSEHFCCRVTMKRQFTFYH